MSRRGQDTQTRMARWWDGTCPIHGLGLVTPPGEAPPPPPPDRWYRAEDPVSGAVVACPHEECTLRVSQWPGKDRFHSRFGWIGGPDEIKAMLLKTNEITADDDKPGRSARQVRTSFQLEE